MKLFSKKLIKIIVIVFIVIIVLAGIGNYIVFSGWPSYENEQFGFMWHYPKGWELSEESSGATVKLAEVGTVCRAYGFENSLIGKSGNPQTLNEFVEWLLNDGDVEIYSQKQTSFAGFDAQEIVWESKKGVYHAIYIISDSNGIGLQCSYRDTSSQKANLQFFNLMKKRFEIDKDYSKSSQELCGDLLGGTIVPVRDRVTFIDGDYTEVTTIPRKNWNRDKLLQEVVQKENLGYVCQPIPLTFDKDLSITSVEWTCESNYKNYEYFEKSNQVKLNSLKSNGHDCEEKVCVRSGGENSSLWFCYK